MQRLQGNREVEASVLRQKAKQGEMGFDVSAQSNGRWGDGEMGCLPVAFGVLPSTMQAAIGLTTTEIAKWLVKQVISESTIPTLEGKLLTFDQATLTLKTHALPHRPQCSACGNAAIMSQQLHQPLSLTSRKKLFTQDGGHRAFTPDQIFQRYEHLISPITGVVSSLTRSSDPENPFVHTYSAVHAFGSSSSLNNLRRSLRHKSAGKGKTDRQSQASGFCEAIERYSGIYQGDEPKIRATLAELGDSLKDGNAGRAIHPDHCLLFSKRQYENRQELNETAIVDHDWIPQPFDPTQAIDWTPVWSLTKQTHNYLPTAFCYYNYKLPRDHRFCSADSNGNAAGGTLEDAILQGFLELVERDSVALWWYNRLSRPAVDLASFNEPYFLDLQNWYQTQQRELWVLDLTTDLNIPAFVAVSRYVGGEKDYIIAGYGAHLDAKIAVSRAVTEVNQIGCHLPENYPPTDSDSALNYWFTHAAIANQPYLAPNHDMPLKQYSDYPQEWSDDIHQDVLHCVDVVKQAGLEMLVLNQTRPDIGLPVVKVIVPGLRHFWSRFGAGRLYDVPVKLGWLSTALNEDEMNPMPMVF
jgi:ribosomal protein S12 methylthiotransferase accessory factor